MKRILTYFLLLAPVLAIAQPVNTVTQPRRSAEESMFKIIFQHDFENDTPGLYDQDEWRRDFNNPTWANRIDRALIEPYEGGKVLKIEFDEGTVSLGEDSDPNPGGGIQFYTDLGPELYEEIYMTYKIKFKPGFNFVLSGKIPGLMGGPNHYAVGPPAWTDGYSCGIAWSTYLSGSLNLATIAFYLYFQDMPDTYGRIYTWADPYSENPYTIIDPDREEPYEISMRIVMNTVPVEGQDGARDGLLEGYVDGKLVSSWTGVRFRNVGTIGTDVFKLYTFFGGNGPDFATLRDEWVYIDDIYLWQYAPGIEGIPYGNVSSAWNRELILPSGGDVTVDPPDPPPPDTEAPSVPAGLTVASVGETAFDIEWEASTDNVAVTGYRLYIDGIFDNATTNTTFFRSGLNPGETYEVAVSAIDAEGNESAPCTPVSITTIGVDVTPPSVPGGLTLLGVTDNFISISWTPSTDNSAVSGYRCFQDGNLVGSVVSNNFTYGGLQASTAYTFTVSATDPTGNESAQSAPLVVSTASPDETPPSVPDGLAAPTVGENFAAITWTASEDDNGVAGYNIYANDVYKGTSLSTSFTMAGLTPGFTYNVEVSAYDLSNNFSERSGVLAVTTAKPPDNFTQPSLPGVSIDSIANREEAANLFTVLTDVGHTELEDFGIVLSESAQGSQGSRIIYANPDSSVIKREGRVSENLQVLYDFSEGSGQYVKDRSGNPDPVDLGISNGLNVKWLPGQGLRVNGAATLQSNGPPANLLSALRSTNEMTVEAWIKSEEIQQDGPARIISLSKDKNTRAFTLGQVNEAVTYDYIVRATTSSTNVNGLPEVGSDVDFTNLNLHHVVYTHAADGKEILYVNNKVVYEGRREGDYSTWSGDYSLLLGNEATLDRPWEGIYYLAAIYNRALDAGEVEQNFEAGIGEIKYLNRLTDLEPSKTYYATPFVRTMEGNVYGQVEEVRVDNVLKPPKDDSLYMATYPNPSDGDFYLYLKKQEVTVADAFIRIADMKGQVVYHRDLDWGTGFVELTIPMELSAILRDGVYTLLLVAGEETVVQRLIIQN